MRGRKAIFIPLAVMLLSACSPAAHSDHSASRPAHAYARYAPESFDDVLWENDRIAFRVYGPALARDFAHQRLETGSGIDVWVKSTRELVVDRWLKRGDYTVDHGEGLDFYHVGNGRGCGGLGIWNGRSLDVSGVWKSHKILNRGPDRAVIELTYAPWITAGGRKIWETRRITLEPGSNLNRIESTIDSDQPGELIVGIGLYQRGAENGEAVLDQKHGLISYWQPPDASNGSIACAILVDPGAVVRLIAADHHYLALIKVTPGKWFTYYAGAGWSKSGDFANHEAWMKYLRAYVATF